MDRTNAIAKLKAAQELRRRHRKAPLFYWKPHEKQLELLDAFITGQYRTGIFTGGNRTGKTTVLAYIALCWMHGYWFHLLPDSAKVTCQNGSYPNRDQVPSECWVRRSDGVTARAARNVQFVTGLSLDKGVGTVFWGKIEELMPEGFATFEGNHLKRGALSVPIQLRLSCGGTLRMGSAEQNAMMFEGSSNDIAIFDEPVRKAVFTAVWRGLIDHYGPFAMGFTPLGEHAAWVYREFIASKKSDAFHVVASQSDNPHLNKTALEEFESGADFTDEELAARKHGEFGFLTHRAFPTFARKTHVIDQFVPPKHWPRIMSCDPANRRPFFFIWLAWDAKNETWIVYREWPTGTPYMKMRTGDHTMADYASLIRTQEGQEKIQTRYLDPRFGPAEYSVKGQKMSSVLDDFAKYGLYFETRIEGIARIETGIIAIRELLSWNRHAPLDEFNKPKLLITENCINMIDALENYSFVPPKQRDENTLDEKTAEAFKDPIDALRYAVLPGPPLRFDRQELGIVGSGALVQENSWGLEDL